MADQRDDHAATRLFAGRIALVTGASSGIGLAIAGRLLDDGARVVALAPELEQTGRDLSQYGEYLHLLPFDLSHAEGIGAALAGLPGGFAAIDTVVNCAGHDRGGRVRFDLGEPGDIASVIDVNLVGMMLVTRAVLPGMVARGVGDIVNLGSISSREPNATIAAYSTSKHGVHGFSLALRSDYADHDLRVTEILPGPVRTGFATARWHGDTVKGKEYYDRRPGVLTPDQVAETVAWALAQPRGVTIAEIVVLPTRTR